MTRRVPTSRYCFESMKIVLGFAHFGFMLCDYFMYKEKRDSRIDFVLIMQSYIAMGIACDGLSKISGFRDKDRAAIDEEKQQPSNKENESSIKDPNPIAAAEENARSAKTRVENVYEELPPAPDLEAGDCGYYSSNLVLSSNVLSGDKQLFIA